MRFEPCSDGIKFAFSRENKIIFFIVNLLPGIMRLVTKTSRLLWMDLITVLE